MKTIKPKKAHSISARAYLLAILGGFLLPLVNCSSDPSEEIQKRSYLPENIRITIPKSLQSSQPGSNHRIHGNRNAWIMSLPSQTFSETGNDIDFVIDVSVLQGFLFTANIILPGFEFQTLFFDSIMEEIRKKFREDGDGHQVLIPERSLNIEITREMVAAMKKVVEEVPGSESFADYPEVGTQLPNPRMCYKEKSSGLKFDLTFGLDEGIPKDICSFDQNTSYIAWNEDRNKVLYGGMAADNATGFLIMLTGKYNDLTRTFLLDVEVSNSFLDFGGFETMTRTTFRITFKQCKDGEKNCVSLKCTANITSQTTVGTDRFGFTGVGRADDDGGFIQIGLTADGSSTIYQERFDANGEAAFQRYKVGTGNWRSGGDGFPVVSDYVSLPENGVLNFNGPEFNFDNSDLNFSR